MQIIKTRWRKSHGVTLQEDIYDNDMVIITPRPDMEELPLPKTDDLGEEEELALEQAMNVQYLVDLTEINTEEG